MRKIYKNLLVIALCLLSVNAVKAGQTIVKTMPLGTSIDGTGIVRLVVKVSPSAVGPDIGFTLHEKEPAAPWNDAMAIGMFDFAKNSNGGLHLAGYNGGSWDWETNVKTVEAGKQIVLWISIDAAGQTHGLSAQMEGETTVTTIYEGYGDRESIKGDNTATAANFCSVFVNDRDGATSADIEIVKDAEIVTSIEPYAFTTATSDIEIKPISIYPTVVTNELTIKSNSAVSNTKVYSLTGQLVLEAINEPQITMAELKAGTYIVSVTTVDGQNLMQKVIKK